MPGSEPSDRMPTAWWHARDDGRLQCDLCPRACRLQEGQRGFCFVRQRLDDQVVLTTWGRASGFCIDPIEKKPLNHFFPGSSVLSFGTAGCNLGCRFCQNWDISKSRAMDRLQDTATPAAIAGAAERHGCRSVAFTYNDPVIFHEYAVDTAAACRKHGVHTVAVTAGYVEPGPRGEFFRNMDAANIDLKGFSDRFYRTLCGASLGPVLDTLEYVANETDTWLEITTLLIPGWNDEDAELERMTRWVVDMLGPDVPMHFTAFHPDWRMLDVAATPRATLRRAREIAKKNGVHHAYTGNVHDPAGQATRCPACDEILIGRTGYDLTTWTLDEGGCCRRCGTRLAGRFETTPGTWGSRRQPIRIGAS